MIISFLGFSNRLFVHRFCFLRVSKNTWETIFTYFFFDFSMRYVKRITGKGNYKPKLRRGFDTIGQKAGPSSQMLNWCYLDDMAENSFYRKL